MKPFRISLIVCAVLLCVTSPLLAKKKTGLRKVIAIGQVDTGGMYLSNLGPGGLSELFKDLLKKKLEKTGRYVVVLPDRKKTAAATPPSSKQTAPTIKPGQTMTPAQAAQLAQQMMQQFSAGGMGGTANDFPVAAQALFRLNVRTGESRTDTGGAVGMAEIFTGSDLGIADFSSESKKITMTCTRHNPKVGSLLDHYRTKASAVRFNQLAGMTHYSYNSYDEFERAMDKNAKKSIGKIAKWIDQKMKGQPWEGKIFKKQGEKIFLNVGASAGIQPGMSFSVFQRQAVTGGGVEFGAEETAIGRIEIVDIKPNYSIGNVSAGNATVGQVVRPYSPSE